MPGPTTLLLITAVLLLMAVAIIFWPQRRTPVRAVEFGREASEASVPQDPGRTTPGSPSGGASAGGGRKNPNAPMAHTILVPRPANGDWQTVLRDALYEEQAVLLSPAPEFQDAPEQQVEITIYTRPDIPIDEKAQLQARIWRLMVAE